MSADPALVLARAFHLIAILQLAGVAVALAWLARGAEARPREVIRRLGHLSLTVALLSGLGWIAFQAQAMSGRAPDADILFATVLDTVFGQSMMVRLGLAAAVLLPLPRGLAPPLAAAMVASFAWSGHAAAGSPIHLGADIVHLLAAAAWLGSLLPLAAVLRWGGSKATLSAVRRFSLLGLVAVTLVTVSGIANAVYLEGSLPGMLGTAHGRVLLVKLALFAGLLAFAAFNRLVLTPRGAAGLPMLLRTTLAESGLALLLLLTVGLLATLPPGKHVQPRWPLPWRIASVWPPVLAPATPTSFAWPTAPLTADRLVEGRRLYDAHCAHCHGEAPKPLVAGDAYWWATEGHGQRYLPEGADGWSVVQALGARGPALTPEVSEGPGIPAADFDFETASGESGALMEENGTARPTLLVFFDDSRTSRQRLDQLALRRPAIEARGARVLAIDLVHPETPAESELAVAVAPGVVKAYRLLVPGTGHTEMLLDRGGTIRAVWRPDDALDWRAAKLLSRQLEALAAEAEPSLNHRH